MRFIISLAGLALIALAVVYVSLPADQLPAFLPGHQAGVMRVHMKHGAVAGAAGIVLIAIAWAMNRRAAA